MRFGGALAAYSSIPEIRTGGNLTASPSRADYRIRQFDLPALRVIAPQNILVERLHHFGHLLDDSISLFLLEFARHIFDQIKNFLGIMPANFHSLQLPIFVSGFNFQHIHITGIGTIYVRGAHVS